MKELNNQGLTAKGKPSAAELHEAKAIFAEKSTFSSAYQTFLRHLRAARRDAGLTQVELGERLGQPQAIISKCERGERRLDVIELRAYCQAMGIPYLHLLEILERDLTRTKDI